jgi:1,4-alpha-glucan branching enzyme
MLERKADGDRVVVTFRIPVKCGAVEVAVLGEFNGWSPDADPMQRDGDEFVVTLTLPPGRRYRFRYLLDGTRWENDWAADGYELNDYGGHDSVLDLTRCRT